MKGVLQCIVEADRREHEAAENEIRDRGTYWAAGEIARLRREIRKLRKQRALPHEDPGQLSGTRRSLEDMLP